MSELSHLLYGFTMIFLVGVGVGLTLKPFIDRWFDKMREENDQLP